MSVCDTCKFGYGYPKPELPIDGFESDIIGKRTGLAKFFLGENIYRGKDCYGWFDDEKHEYEMKVKYHNKKIWCEAEPEGKCVDKHDSCSFYQQNN